MPVPGRTRARLLALSRLALVGAAAIGAGGGAWALGAQPVADFLSEGPVRVLGLAGGARRAVIGGGSLLAVLVATAVAVPRPPVRWRAVAGLLAMGVAVALAPATAFPAAALYGLAVAAAWLAQVEPARLAAAAPRRHPRAWVAGGTAAAVAVLALGVTAFWLARPLADRGRAADEGLAFAVGAEPAAGGAVQAPVVGAGQVLAQGNLVGADSFHFGSGRVRLLRAPDGMLVLRFEEYEVRNGPDLFVYLTPDPGGDVDASGAVSLGMVRATRGAVNYAVPATADAARFRAAVIWCKSFAVTFAVARFE